MIDIVRIQTLTPVITPSPPEVVPSHPVADRAEAVHQEDRRQRRDRRQYNKKPIIERRVSSDRRKPLFDAEA